MPQPCDSVKILASSISFSPNTKILSALKYESVLQWKPFNRGTILLVFLEVISWQLLIFIFETAHIESLNPKKIIKEKLADKLYIMICNWFLDFCLCCFALKTFTPTAVVQGFMISTFWNLNSFLLSIPWLFC